MFQCWSEVGHLQILHCRLFKINVSGKKYVRNLNSFTLFHLNFKSMAKHFESLTDYFASLPSYFSVVGLTETWLNDFKVSLYSINGYNHLFSHRKGRAGGGVSLFVKASIRYTLWQHLVIGHSNTDSYVEFIFIQLVRAPCFPGHAVIGSVYRLLSCNVNSFVHDELLNTIEKDHKPCVLLGDFKIHLLQHNSEKCMHRLFTN